MPEAGSAGRQRQGEVSGEAWQGQAGLGAACEGRNLACSPRPSAHTQMPGWAGDRGGAQGHGEGTWRGWSWRGQGSCSVSEGGSWGMAGPMQGRGQVQGCSAFPSGCQVGGGCAHAEPGVSREDGGGPQAPVAQEILEPMPVQVGLSPAQRAPLSPQSHVQADSRCSQVTY